jgi:predicted metalloprotease with PDZ domain
MHVILSGLAIMLAQAGAADVQRYDVSVHDSPAPTASVTATITVGGEYLSVRNGGNDLPNGFATFVNLKSVRDENGASVGFTRDSVSRWKLSRAVRSAHLEYDVDFKFAREPWPSGNEQAGQWEAGALYTVTKPLFVIGSTDAPAEVAFILPAGWRVATPWRSLQGRANTFVVDNEPGLTDNSIVLGRFNQEKLVAGPFTFTLATFGRTAGSAALMSKVLNAVAREYMSIFPSTPPTSYLMTVFSGSENDGEAFAQSFAFRTGEVPTSANSLLWSTTLAHELFHFWNGHTLRGTDGVASAWLSEGVTEYYANRSLLRTGSLPPSAFLAKAENMAGLYVYFRTQPMFDSVTIAQAGSRRTRYRFGVYNGGWAMGFALDRQIAMATSGRARLDDVMRELFRRHSNRTPYTIAEVFEIASNIAGKPMQPFLAKYVEGMDLLPMKDLFASIGIEADFISYTGEAYFRFAAHPSPAQQLEWKRYSGTGASHTKE